MVNVVNMIPTEVYKLRSGKVQPCRAACESVYSLVLYILPLVSPFVLVIFNQLRSSCYCQILTNLNILVFIQ